MKFSNKSNSSSYINAGRAAAKYSADSFIAARRNAPDYGKLAETNIKNRSNERVAAIKAEAAVHKAGIKAKQGVKRTQIKTDAETSVLNSKLGARKFAGIVGGLGTLAAGGIMLAAPKDEDDKNWKDKYHQKEMELMDARIASLKNKGNKEYPDAPEETPFVEPTESTDTSSTDTSSSTQKPKPIASTIKPNGGRLSQSQIQQLAIKHGFPADVAPTIAKIAMGESGGELYAHNPDRSTGDNSYGIMQINMIDDMGVERRNQFGLKSNEELFDPDKNMAAAFKIYQAQGLEAWGAYTNGSYSKFK